MRALSIAPLVAAVSASLLISAPTPRETMSWRWTLASVSSSNEQELGRPGADHAAISVDGARVAFRSAAPNMFPGVSGSQIYLRDVSLGVTSLISQPSGPSDVAGDGPSDWPRSPTTAAGSCSSPMRRTSSPLTGMTPQTSPCGMSA
jgi:hypothetical protein